jgi:hypothetical protein
LDERLNKKQYPKGVTMKKTKLAVTIIEALKESPDGLDRNAITNYVIAHDAVKDTEKITSIYQVVNKCLNNLIENNCVSHSPNRRNRIFKFVRDINEAESEATAPQNSGMDLSL